MTRILSLASLVLALGIAQGCSDSYHYRTRHDGESFYAVMHEDVSNGETIARVRQLLGPGQEVVDQEVIDKLLNHMTSVAAKHPAAYPDGVQDGDVHIPTLAEIPSRSSTDAGYVPPDRFGFLDNGTRAGSPSAYP